jgi:uncharacterized paraquat-inducible protein A
MSLHLFSKPTECTQCGTVVEDPTVDRCPNCKALLRERRSPHRVAGVPTRYGSLRILLAALRFLGVIVIILGVLVFFSAMGDEGFADVQTGGILVGSILVAVSMFSLAAFFELTMDVEENTRAAFRLQQFILTELQEMGARYRADHPPVVEDVPAAASAEPPVAVDAPLRGEAE